MLLVAKKPDTRSMSSCAKHHFLLDDMIQASVMFHMFEANAMYKAMDSNLFSLFIGFITAQDCKGQLWSMGFLSQFDVKKLILEN